MQTLVFTINAPIARHGGAALRNMEVIRVLREFGPVDVVSFGEPAEDPIEGVREHLSWSREDLAAGRTLVDRARAQAWPLLPRGHWRLNHLRSRRATAEVLSLVRCCDHDLVVASQWPVVEHALAAAGADRRLVFDTHNVEADLQPSIGALGSGTGGAPRARLHPARRLGTPPRGAGRRGVGVQ